jgi:5'(3')-deoxyribonucleotidase
MSRRALKKIALDFDNVLADTMTGWINYYNKQFGRSLKKADITLWKFWELKSIGMEKGDSDRIFEEVWFRWQELRPLESNVGSTVKKLGELGDLDIVTAAKGEINEWLRFHNVRHKNLIKTRSSKKAELDYDIFIDDSPDDALEFGKRKKVCLLYDQPWNQPNETQYLYKEYSTIFRIKKLEEALDFIARMV